MEKLSTGGEWKKKSVFNSEKYRKGTLKKYYELNWGEIWRKKKASL